MSQFYNRYVPSTKPTETSTRPSEVHPKPQKRKLPHDAAQEQQQNKKSKHVSSEQPAQNVKPAGRYVDTQQHSSTTKQQTGGDQILDKYRITSAAGSNGTVDIRIKKPQNHVSPPRDNNRKPGISESKVKRKKIAPEPQTGAEEQEEQYQTRHASVFSKLDKVKKTETQTGLESHVDTMRDKPHGTISEEVHGLDPIPQPANNTTQSEEPIYPTLSKWQSNAVKVVPGTRPDFQSLGLSESLINNLSSKDMKQAFPIQSTVIPLLLRGSHKHNGDICVSAATGSGKTLAYVIPIVETLRNVKTTKLRAVVVVPTRELVQQVRQMCDLCVAGTSLTVASASGNKSLDAERTVLVEETEVYDPEEYERRQKQAVDWSNFSLQKLMSDIQDFEPLESINLVKSHNSKVDILITTPGRLVDHLTSTPGFNLDHVEWLIVDEADRLLNESYQEWTETVVPALTSRVATAAQDRVLSYMRMDIPPRIVTKVLLSATMTNDITKLNSLGLRDPKLVVLGSGLTSAGQDTSSDKQSQAIKLFGNGTGTLHLPSTLSENAIAINEASDKPLYLLKLLDSLVASTISSDRSADARADSQPSVSSSSSSPSSDDESDDSPSSRSSTDTESDSKSTLDGSTSSNPNSSSSGSATSSSRIESSLKDKHIGRPNQQLVNGSSHQQPRALVFTRSTASAMRLSRLISMLSPIIGSTISTLTRSTAASASSRRAFSAFRAHKTCVLIATDRASRGLDLPNLEFVINYDVPSSALTYIHRVGRTARAGNNGSAWTLVEHKEGAWFWREIGGKQSNPGQGKRPEESIHRSGQIKRVQMTVDDNDLKRKYEDALKQLGKEVKGQLEQ